MKTFTAYLKKRNSKDKNGIINIRFTENRKNEFFSTKISIPERSWNKNSKEVRSSYLDYESINQKILDKIEEVKVLKEIEVDSTEIPYKEKSFLNYYKGYMDSLLRKQQFGNYKKYNTCYQHILGYNEEKKNDDTLFSDINLDWIEKVDEYIDIKGVGKNTRNNYLKCCQKLYRKAIKGSVPEYKTIDADPFLDYKFTNTKVDIQFLCRTNLQSLVAVDLEKNSKIEEIRNRFLTQIYLCGCRVSDLFTIRYKQIYFDDIFSSINFVQYKSKKKHSVQLSYDLTKHIFYYVNREIYYDMYYNRKYKVTVKDGDKRVRKQGTLPQFEKYSLKIKPYLKGTKNPEYELFTDQIGGILGKLFDEQLDIIREYSIDHPNDFIVPVMSNELFSDVEFGINRRLNKQQYNHMDSKAATYNKDLKHLQQYTGNSNLTIKSHTARHSYANLIISTGGDVYTASKSLGHCDLSTTQAYVEPFNKEVINDVNDNAFRVMRLEKMKSSNR